MRDVSQPYTTDDNVVVGDFEGYLHAMSRDDGRLTARIELNGGAIRIAPLPMDDGLLVQTSGGQLYSLTINKD